MSFNEQTFACIGMMQNIIREHFERMQAKIKICDDKASKELRTISKFMNDLHYIGTVYEKSLFKLCEDFQQQMKLFIHDEKLSQYYQLVINCLLRHGDTIQKQYEQLNSVRSTFEVIDRDFKMTTDNILESVNSSLNIYKEKSQEFDYLYRKYVKSSVSLNGLNSPIKRPKSGRNSGLNESNEFFSAQNAEDQALSAFADLENLFQFNMGNLKGRISDCFSKELNVKYKMRQGAVTVLNSFGANLNADFEKKTATLESNPDSYRCYFEHLEKENSLEFNQKINFTNYELKFCSFYNFLKLDNLFEQPYARTLCQKVFTLGKTISPRIRIYIDLLLENLYRQNAEFSKEIIEEINFIMSNVKTSEYLIYMLVFKKCQLLYEKPFVNITFKREQFKNLQPIAQYFFLNYLNSTDVNCEAIFTFLKFSLTIFNEQKNSFIESLSKIVILNDAKFWLELMNFINQNYKVYSGLEGFVSSNITSNVNVITGIRSIVGAIKTNLNAQPSKEVGQNKAFDDVSFFLFKLRLDFETITDILLSLAPKAGVSFDNVKAILQRNQDLFLSQISGQNTSTEEQEKSLAKISRSLNKWEKIALVCKKCVQFLNSPKDVFKIITLNQFMYAERKRIFMRALLNFDLTKLPHFRRSILKTKIEAGMARKHLKVSGFQDADSIIALDVKRTFCNNPNFNSSNLELILKNISHPEIGRFSYYQGLNYIASYFYVVFDGNELDTYNFVISMMHNYFFNYVDSELKNLKRLFFCLKRLVKAYLPILYNYLENEQKLDMDIIFASWCLTLFTTITQYYSRSVYLDEIIDIFICKGWPGFFKVVLVILESLEEKILTLGYEDILVLLSELPKNDFAEFVAAESQRSKRKSCAELQLEEITEQKTEVESPVRFSFKQRIKHLTKVNKTLMICYHNEYYRILEQIDEFWHKINKKIRISS